MSKDTATFTRDSARRIGEAVREVERSRTVSREPRGRRPRPTFDEPGQQQFVAEIVGEGPNGEDDFIGATYWVREISLVSLEAVVNGRWVRALNLCEIGSPHHVLRNIVLGEDVPQRLGHVFSSYPGQMVPLWGYKVDCLDENGCPQGEWFEMFGPGFVSTTQPPACTPEPMPGRS